MSYQAPLRNRYRAPLEGYIFVGQSNMVGISSPSDNFTSERNDSLIPVWKQAGTDPVPANTDGVITLEDARGQGNCGCEQAFMREIHALGRRRAIGVKFAVNGKGLYNFFKPNNRGYLELLDAIAKAQRDYGGAIKWNALLWVQGHNDASTSQSVADAYASNLTVLVDALRLHLHEPNLKFVSPQHPPSWCTAPYATTVKAQVTSFCAGDANAVSFDADDTTTRDGGTHYELGSFEILGKRMAQAYLAERDH